MVILTKIPTKMEGTYLENDKNLSSKTNKMVRKTPKKQHKRQIALKKRKNGNMLLKYQLKW